MLAKVSRWVLGVVVVVLGAGCSAGGDSPGGPLGGGGTGANGATGGSGGSSNGGFGSLDSGADAFPSGECGYAQIPTVREPGGVLIVFDQSSSMEEDDAGRRAGDTGYDPATSRWAITTTAINQVLPGLPPDAEMGLMLFPNSFDTDYCAPLPKAHVDIGPLSQTLPAIQSTISPSRSFGGSVTPLAQALQAGHNYLKAVELPGRKAVLLVTDGAPSPACGQANQETAQVSYTELTQSGQLTFVVGLEGSAPGLMSLTASNGGTSRAPDCNPTCCAGLICTDVQTCCHYTAEGADTGAKLSAALEEIASKFLSSCVFSVPKGSDPDRFDENQVNVVVRIGGGDRTILPRDAEEGWDYVGGGTDSLEIYGATCEELLSESSSVEILLGCPTVVK